MRATSASLMPLTSRNEQRIAGGVVVGSGGLSHDPPTPRIDNSRPDATQRLIDRATPTQADYDARETRVVQAARDLVIGKGPCLAPSEQWDRDFLAYLKKLEGRKPVIWCGDLNVAHTEIDLARPKDNVKNHGFTPKPRRSEYM